MYLLFLIGSQNAWVIEELLMTISLAVFVVVSAYARAVDGYEDEAGFHFALPSALDWTLPSVR